MFFKRKPKIKKEVKEKIELQINDMKLYLENNYKDLAIQARKDAIKLVESYHEAGELEEVYYKEYKNILDTYTEAMKNYNHQEFYHS